jgi:hypothetical protein
VADLSDIQRIRSDPWEFLRGVRTQDQVDLRNPIKPFPVHLDYLKLYTRIWQKHPKILAPKSRRMIMSWTNIALYTWDFLFFRGRHNAFVSKKEDDSDELVRRAHFIATHLDPQIIPKEIIPRVEIVYTKLKNVDLGSVIQGFPSGANQLRQYTFSGILADEMAFWDDAEDMYSASYPTIQGGGRFTGISSRNPGFFKRLVYDQLDQEISYDS